MTRRFLLIACCLVVCPTLAIRASHAPLPPATAAAEAGRPSPQPAPDCGGQPCDAVVRGLLGFFDRHPRGVAGNGRSCADCHMATDHFQLSPASVEARFQLLQLRRRWDRKADDPLFRPIDADDFRTSGENAGDFGNLRRNGLVRIVFPLPPNLRLVDPATNAPSSETFVDLWRAVPSVNDVALTGPDGANPWARGPNVTGGYQLDARVTTLQDQALHAFSNHAQAQFAPPQQLLDDIASFQQVLFTNGRVRALADAVRRGSGSASLPDADPALSELEAQGKAGSPARAVSATAARGSRQRSRLRSGFTPSRRSVHAPSMRQCQRGSRSRPARNGWQRTSGPTRSPCRWPRRAQRRRIA